MSWSLVSLGSLCHKITDGSHNPPKGIANSDYLMLSSKNIFHDKINFENPRYLTQEGFERENKRTDVCENDVLLTIVGTIGRAAVVPANQVKFTLQRSVAVLKPKIDQVAPRFLMYVLQSLTSFLEKSSRGVAQKGIYLKQLKELQIPLPPLPEQQKIAAILDAANQLRQKDQQLIEHYTRLGQSLFLEMFGDIFINPKKFPLTKLEKLLSNKKDIVDGPFGSSINTKVDYREDGEIPVIRTKNVSTKNNFLIHDLKFMKREKYESVIRSQVLPGDLVLTKVGTIGNICIMPDLYDEYVLSTTGSCRIRINEENMNKLYLLHYLNFYKPKMLDIASAGVQAFLNMKHIKGFDILCPPITLQNQFAQHIEAIEQQKQQAQSSLEKSEALFNSLLQRAFKGELTG